MNLLQKAKVSMISPRSAQLLVTVHDIQRRRPSEPPLDPLANFAIQIIDALGYKRTKALFIRNPEDASTSR